MVRHVQMSKDMRNLTPLPERNNSASAGARPALRLRTVESGDELSLESGIKSLRTRFNPALIGFGIVGPATLDSVAKKHNGKNVPAAATLGSGKSESGESE